MTTFEESGLKPEILRAIADMGFTEPTPVQAQTLPMIDDMPPALVALAQTGTGKTAGFGLPLLHNIDASSKDTQALVLCPTRELCLQITDDFMKYKAHMRNIFVTAIYGGAPIHTQAKALHRGSQVVVGTPGRVVDMIKRGALKLGSLQVFVLDEADEMLNMGFKDDLESIFNETPADKSTWLFSATMPPKVESMARRYMKDAVRISTGKRNEGATNVTHEYYSVSVRDKFEALKRIIDTVPDVYCVIFCRTREETNAVASKLNTIGYPAEAINGALSQQQRDKVMGRFRKKQITMLVATDVAARGIDISDLTHVINYSLPDDPEVYVHRSGRTGRAGKSGVSISILNGRERGRLRELEKMTGKTFEQKQVPTVEEIGKIAVAKHLEEFLNTDVKSASISPILTDVMMQFEDMSREDIIEQFAKWAYKKAVGGRESSQDINLSGSGRGDDRDSGRRRERGDRDRGRGDGRDRDRGGRKERDDEGKFVRLDFNMGAKQSLNPGRLMGIINEVMNNSSINFGKIEIDAHKAAIDVDSEHAMAIAKEMSGTQFGDRKVKVDIGAEPLGRSTKPSYGDRGDRGGNRGDRSGAKKRYSSGGRDGGRSGGRRR